MKCNCEGTSFKGPPVSDLGILYLCGELAAWINPRYPEGALFCDQCKRDFELACTEPWERVQ